MRFASIVVMLSAFAASSLALSDASAQQVTIATPFQSNNHSFFERTGTNWGFQKGNMFFSFGAPNMGIPQFGGYDPSAGINSGFRFGRGDLSGYFNFGAAHGSRQSSISQTPMVTMMNGQTASIVDRSVSPFVMGLVPVVGGYPTTGYMGPMLPDYPFAGTGYGGGGFGGGGFGGGGVSPLYGNPQVRAMIENMQSGRTRSAGDLPEPPAPITDRAPAPRPKPVAKPKPGDIDLAAAEPAVAVTGGAAIGSSRSSSAGRAVPSVAEARRLYEAEQAAENDEAMVLFERGRAAELEGRHGAARVFYQMVARRASGRLRDQAQKRLHSISSPGTP